MMFKATSLLVLLCIACADSECNDDCDILSPLKMAAAQCGNSPTEMVWLRNLLENMETDETMVGNIYLIRSDGQPAFAHQPLVMSCMGCVVYRCNGTRIPQEQLNSAEVISQMKEENLLYEAF